MATWDIAREGRTCVRRGCEIGQGEAFRVGKVGAICEDCSLELDGEAEPDFVEPRSFLDRVRDDIAQAPPRPEKPGALMPVHASQPAFDPRVQGHRRPPVARPAAPPTSIDVWRRAAGERDE